MENEPIELDLPLLSARWRLSFKMLGSFVESAAVLLDRYHTPPGPPAEGSVEHCGEAPRTARVCWVQPDEVQRASYDNDDDATRDGAYAMAFAAAWALEGYVVVRRARSRTGSDFLLLREGEPANDFIKLEVSGIADDLDSRVGWRVFARRSRRCRKASRRGPRLRSSCALARSSLWRRGSHGVLRRPAGTRR